MNHIPTWVFVLFFVLLYLGIKRCYTRTLSLERLALIPVIFIVIGLRSALQLFGVSVMGFILLLGGSLIGYLIGYYLVKNSRVLADKEKRLIQVPGDISMLIMVMTIFCIEFFIHYSIEAHWTIAHSPLFKALAMILTGSVVGVSMGKNVTYFLKYRQAESTNLNVISSTRT
jgi:hypothetical protein